jgi:hypothetical protein
LRLPRAYSYRTLCLVASPLRSEYHPTNVTNNMTDQSEPPATIAEMKVAVGSLFMLWSRVEADLAKAIDDLSAPSHTDKPHGIGRSLATWKALHDAVSDCHPDHSKVVESLHTHLKEALSLRNSIAHGLDGYGVAESDGSSEAHFRCSLKGGPEVITLDQLRACLTQLSRGRTHIGRLTYAALRPGELGMQNLYDDLSASMGK